MDDIFYYEGEEAPNRRHVVVPAHSKQKILDEHHDLPFLGHFAAKKMAENTSIGKDSRVMSTRSALPV